MDEGQAAVFQACYSDWKVIKTRKVVQIHFEVPLEMEGLAYQCLGGMPSPASSVWCAIARLAAGTGGTVPPVGEGGLSSGERPPSHSHKSWDELSAAQQAGILCSDPKFREHLRGLVNWEVFTEEDAAEVLRRRLKVPSRRDIGIVEGTLEQWNALVSGYRAWARSREAA